MSPRVDARPPGNAARLHAHPIVVMRQRDREAAAFMRAAYGKGYCDALTEESPGSLCEEHGYRVPERRFAQRDAV